MHRVSGRSSSGWVNRAGSSDGPGERRERAGVVVRGVPAKTVPAGEPSGRAGGWEPTDGAEHACGGVDVGVREEGRFPAGAVLT